MSEHLMSEQIGNTTQRFKRNLATFFRARYPYLYVSTWEEIRVLSLIREVAKEASLIRTPRQVFVWSATEGVVGEEQTGIREPAPLKALEFIEKYREPAIFILKDFHVYLGHGGQRADTKLIRKLRDMIVPQ